MNIVDDIRAHLTSTLTLYGPMYVDAFGTTVESLMIRGDPSSARETEFVDGSFTGTQTLSFYARSASPATAIAALEAIRAALDDTIIALTGVTRVEIYPVTLPAFVDKDDAGISTYYLTVNVEYDGNNAKGV
jgi:hypothetical protein